MFHTQMKQKFSKQAYISDRAHVFMGHFGVDEFDYEVGEPELLESWTMGPDTPMMLNVYRVPVTIVYEKSKWGNVAVEQDVYVVDENGKWTVMWDYKGE